MTMLLLFLYACASDVLECYPELFHQLKREYAYSHAVSELSPAIYDDKCGDMRI